MIRYLKVGEWIHQTDQMLIKKKWCPVTELLSWNRKVKKDERKLFRRITKTGGKI